MALSSVTSVRKYLDPTVLAPLLRKNDVKGVEKAVGPETDQFIKLDDKETQSGIDSLIQSCDNGTEERLHPGNAWESLLPKLQSENRQAALLKKHSVTGNTVLTVACEHGHPSFPYYLLKDSNNPIELINKVRESKPNPKYKTGNRELLNSPVWADHSKANSPYWQSSSGAASSNNKKLTLAGKEELVKAMPEGGTKNLLGYAVYGPDNWQKETFRLEAQEVAEQRVQKHQEEVDRDARLTEAIAQFTPEQKAIYDGIGPAWHNRTVLAEHEQVIQNIKLGKDPFSRDR